MSLALFMLLNLKLQPLTQAFFPQAPTDILLLVSKVIMPSPSLSLCFRFYLDLSVNLTQLTSLCFGSLSHPAF